MCLIGIVRRLARTHTIHSDIYSMVYQQYLPHFFLNTMHLFKFNFKNFLSIYLTQYF